MPDPSPRESEAMRNDYPASSDTIPEVTTQQRQRGKSMSRRSGQSGTIVIEGGWYRVRFRIDVPGQYKRKQMSVKNLPSVRRGTSDQIGARTPKGRNREPARSQLGGALQPNSCTSDGQTFREQAKKWLHQCLTRKRKPVKPATIRGWEATSTSI